MSRFFKLAAFSALLTTLVGGIFWFWDQSLSANVMPERNPESDKAYAADEMTDEERELLRRELEALLG